MIVREALVTDPRVVEASASAREAAELLTHAHVESALVVDGERLLGCITAATFVSAAARGLDLSSLTAEEICDGEMPTIGPDELLDEALHRMSEHGLERLAVVEDGRLLGVLLREPLVRRLAEGDSGG